jgi:predicted HNH restriction endonuclease
MQVIITENDESQWEDRTGVLYNFPSRYINTLKPGTKAIYYKGRLQNKSFKPKRLSDDPHYFGICTIGEIHPDTSGKKNAHFAQLLDYQEFTDPVVFKINGKYIEPIPKNKKSNYWRDGVRQISKSTYDKITKGKKYTKKPKIGKPSKTSSKHAAPSDSQGHESALEGSKTKHFTYKYERNPKLRKKAIEIHGTKCKACGFDFKKIYGKIGEGYVHIHHKVPISKRGGAVEVSAEKDLIPLCANCHSIIHRRRDSTLSLSQLKKAIKANT